MSRQLEIKSVSVAFDQINVVDQVSFSLREGAIGCLLGPSGCGKTSLLRAIAGFESVTEGEIWLHDRQMSSRIQHLSPEKRRVGMVFQDNALFPHLSIKDNIGFGLQQLTELERIKRITELLQLIELDGIAHRYPHQISGGQQQRVALARAMAPRPDILLLDEPFSALDPALRGQLARDVRNLLHEDGITAILVTHDQTEAFTMADHIGVMNQGTLHQWDTASNLYYYPNTDFVANFIGKGVLLPVRLLNNNSIETPLGTVTCKLPSGIQQYQHIRMILRPENININSGSESGSVPATVQSQLFQGVETFYTLLLNTGEMVECLAPSHHNFATGTTVKLSLNVRDIVLFSDEGKRISS